MSIIAFIISIFLLFLSLLKREKKAITPMNLFYLLWSFILFLSIFSLYNIKKPSDEAYFLIILMLIFFFLGNYTSIISNKIIKNKNIDEDKNVSNNYIRLMSKVFYALCIATIIFNLIDCIIVIKNAIDGIPMWKIRNWSLQPYGSENPLLSRRSFLEDAFRSIVLTPFSLIVYPIVAYFFFYLENKKQKYILLFFSLAILITSSIAGAGGRLGFIFYFGCFLLAFYINYKNKDISMHKKNKFKKNIIIIFFLGMFFVILYTIFRTGSGNLFKPIYTYFALPPTLLSIWLPDIKNVQHTYGLLTFFGVHSFFFRMLDSIGLTNFIPNIYNISYKYILGAEIFKNTGYGVGNAFVTPIYYFFLDGGYPFVCIASYFFGMIVSRVYLKMKEYMDVREFTLYILIMYGIFVSFMRIQTAIPSYIISIIIAMIILRKTNKKK